MGDFTAQTPARHRISQKPAATLRGDEPDGLSLEKLPKPALSTVEGNLPVRWEEQQEGMATAMSPTSLIQILLEGFRRGEV